MATTEEKLVKSEERIGAVEEKLVKLAQSIADVPTTNGGDSAALREYQLKMLDELRVLRVTLGAARREQDQLQKERDESVAEAKQLRTDKAKLEYRVKHLIRSLEEEEAKNSSK